MTQSVSILLAEREPLFRRGLATCLERDHRLTVTASVSTAHAALSAATASTPAIAIVGISLPDQPGFGPITTLSHRFSALKVIALVDAAHGDAVLMALRAGATTCIGKDVTEERLLHVVGQAGQLRPLNEELVSQRPPAAMSIPDPLPKHAISEGENAPAGLPLTCREFEILRSIGAGMTNAEIGLTLGISAQTVKNHVTAILRKLAVSDRTQAVVLAMRRGWLPLNDVGYPDRAIEPRLPAPAARAWSMAPRR